MKDFMAQFGARLVDNGYPVIPIMPGAKVPGHFRKGAWAAYPDWTRHCDRVTKSFEIDIWRRWPDCAVGIACGAVVGIDIDVPDASVAVALTDLAKRMLGETPIQSKCKCAFIIALDFTLLSFSDKFLSLTRSEPSCIRAST